MESDVEFKTKAMYRSKMRQIQKNDFKFLFLCTKYSKLDGVIVLNLSPFLACFKDQKRKVCFAQSQCYSLINEKYTLLRQIASMSNLVQKAALEQLLSQVKKQNQITTTRGKWQEEEVEI